MKLLIVEDNAEIAELVAFACGQAGFESTIAQDVPAARRSIESGRPDLVVLDLNLGQWDGLDLLREIRRESLVPVVVLTARGGEDDKVRAFELGADDYVTKPFSARELVARIEARLRRMRPLEDGAPHAPACIHTIGPVSVNVSEHSVHSNGQLLKLTVTEFRLLLALLKHEGSVVESQRLLKDVWGYADGAGTDVVRVTIHRLRQKLKEAPSAPRLIHTVPGVGFMLKSTDAS